MDGATWHTGYDNRHHILAPVLHAKMQAGDDRVQRKQSIQI
jgi:hypothetical protein